VILFALILTTSEAHRRHIREALKLPNETLVIPSEEHNPYTGDVYCATEPVYRFQNKLNRRLLVGANNSCFDSHCDDPAVRDKTPTDEIKLRIAFTVWNEQITRVQLDAVIAEYAKRLKQVNIHVVVHGTHWVKDTTFGQCIPAYSTTNDQWYYDLVDMKAKHAKDVGKAMNVFIGCQDKGKAGSGTLLGIATFPWDPIALSKYGGLWLNAVTMFPDDSTFLHESGHCFGLRHAFSGVDENENCDPNGNVCGLCCEMPHVREDSGSAKSNYVGDFCSDTAAQPRRWECNSAPGEACNDIAWGAFGPTDYENPMSYAMVNPNTMKEEHCQKDFTEQQKRRMHCYLRSSLAGWIEK